MSITVCVFSIFVIVEKVFDGGIRSFNAETMEEAIILGVGAKPEEYLCEPIIVRASNRDFCILVYEKDSDKIYCCFLERKKEKYAYIYQYEFNPNEITDEFGLNAFDIFKQCDVVIGIMPAWNSSVIINDKIISDSEEFSFQGNNYKIWYATVDGGFDSIKKIKYHL